MSFVDTVKKTIELLIKVVATLFMIWIIISAFFFPPSTFFALVLLEMSRDKEISERDSMFVSIILGLVDVAIFVYMVKMMIQTGL